MEEIYDAWIRDFGIDGFRIDTMKHVNLEFWQQFLPAHPADRARRRASRASSRSARSRHGTPTRSCRASRPPDAARRCSTSPSSSRRASSPPRTRPTRWRRSSRRTTGSPTPTRTPTSCPRSWATTTWATSACSCATTTAGAPESELLARDRLAHALMYFCARQPGRLLRRRAGLHRRRAATRRARQDMFASQDTEYDNLDDDGTDPATARTSTTGARTTTSAPTSRRRPTTSTRRTRCTGRSRRWRALRARQPGAGRRRPADPLLVAGGRASSRSRAPTQATRSSTWSR